MTHGGPSAFEAAHAILIAKPGANQGKVMIITAAESWVWDRASPHSITGVMDNVVGSLFCAGHAPDGEATSSFPAAIATSRIRCRWAALQAQDIGSVSLISPGAVTHHYDWNQRFVRLASVPVANDPTVTTLLVSAPANQHPAPKGWFMLFITTNPTQFTTAFHDGSTPVTVTEKVPSIGVFVKVE